MAPKTDCHDCIDGRCVMNCGPAATNAPTSKSDVPACKHTEGPWRSAAAPSSVVGWPVIGPQGRVICNLAWLPKRPDTSKEDWLAYMEECHGNANLIEAAPNLLEALRRVDHTLSLHGKVDGDTDLHRFVQAAIAKAEGPQ